MTPVVLYADTIIICLQSWHPPNGNEGILSIFEGRILQSDTMFRVLTSSYHFMAKQPEFVTKSHNH